MREQGALDSQHARGWHQGIQSMRDRPAVHPGGNDWVFVKLLCETPGEQGSQWCLHAAAAAGWPVELSRLCSHQASAHTPAMEGSQGTPIVGSHDSPHDERNSGGQPLQLPRAGPTDERDYEDARGMPTSSGQYAGPNSGQGSHSGSKAQSDGER